MELFGQSRVVRTARSSGPQLSHLSISKATVSLSVEFVTGGDTASVSELCNNPLFTALNECTVESLVRDIAGVCQVKLGEFLQLGHLLEARVSDLGAVK